MRGSSEFELQIININLCLIKKDVQKGHLLTLLFFTILIEDCNTIVYLNIIIVHGSKA